ncbi:MAG: GerMN domain-containing protein [Lachnospiraceae bacterium]|nr:GerMN domain-containing protein [Lachnospiraceae bacterium]
MRLKSISGKVNTGIKRVAVAALLIMLLISGCGRQEEESVPGLRIYYLNARETALTYESYETEEESPAELASALLKDMAVVPGGAEKRAVIQNFSVKSFRVEGNQIVLDLSQEYLDLSPVREVLTRAALVRTLSQIEGIEGVSMMVEEAPLTDAKGNPVGVMNADSFVDNEGAEINAYDRAQLKIYYADAEGKKLVPAVTDVVYNTNTSMEKLVVEQLIKGPEGMDIYQSVPADTRLISVTVSDGVCYVNLDSAFLNPVGNVTPEVTIYSIVDSLAELSNVHRVQFMVEGSSDVIFREQISLEQEFTRNLEIVE